LLLVPLMLVWAITGNPLSASQKGLAQIEVEGNILGSTPLVGPVLQRILIGGEEVGHLTLTHLYFLHVGLLPLLVTVLLVIHVSQVYRHGLTPRRGAAEATSARPYWPYQSIRNLTVLTAVMGLIAFLALRYGAPLDAPADTTIAHVPRPEWYFRPLFELRRYFTGDWEFVATIVIPSAALLLLLVIPAIDRWCWPRVSLVVRLALIVVGLGAVGGLTLLSFSRDWRDAEFLAAEEGAAERAERARELARHQHVPPEGAVALLRNDAKMRGPLLFAEHCASCHSHTDSRGQGIASNEPSAPNLFGFGSPAWIGGILDPDRIVSDHYFGNTKFADGEMVATIAEKFDSAGSPEEAESLRDQLADVARALSAEAALPRQAAEDTRDAQLIAKGKELLAGDLACTDCHRFHDAGELGSAPDLTGYGSREWLIGMIGNPQHERFYADDRNDRMPAFAADAHQPRANLLSQRDIELLVDWLRGDWYEPPPTGVPGVSAAAPEIAQR
jgi:ubiquinol-cytochrome c reductase cytochrome b subunit